MLDMSDSEPQIKKLSEPSTPDPDDLSHEEKSITGSGQTVGLEPGEQFVPPTMALDSLQDDSDE